MSTYITVTSGTGALVNRVKQVQQANREAQLQRESDTALETQVTADATAQAAQTQRPIGGNPDTSIDRRPAAQRELGSVMGVEYTTTVIPNVPQPTFRLTVGPPGQQQTAQVETLGPSGAAATNQPAATDTSSGEDSVLGFLILHDPPNFFGNDWTTEYPCGYFFQTGKGAAPTSSWAESRIPRVVTQDYDDSAYYLLPIGKETCIFVYVYSKLRTLTVYERRDRTDRISVNARPVEFGCGFQTGTYYDRESTFRTEDIFSNIEERQAYQVMAFVVSPKAVRVLEVPLELDALMRQLHPPMAVNDTVEVLGSSQYTRYEFADVRGQVDPQNYNGPVTYGMITVPYFNATKHREGSLHGNYASGNDVLAKQFGLGYLNTDSHDGDFFTPAVYRFIRAAMNLSSASTQSYAYMRSTFFGTAPKKYLAPCAVDGSCPVDSNDEPTTVVFDTTKTEPVNINTEVSAGSFQRGRKYQVPLNGADQYDVVYGWDWDNANYCRQQLAALGFAPADLKP